MSIERSELISTREEAIAYYASRLAGDHVLTLSDGSEIVVRFVAEEIHLFSEALNPNANPDPAKLIWRRGRSAECRVFSKVRARLLDAILPTICAPTKSLQAKMRGGGVQLFGPPSAGQRLSVVVGVERTEGSECYFVRTAFPVSDKDFAAALRAARPSPWPPK